MKKFFLVIALCYCTLFWNYGWIRTGGKECS